MASVSPIPLTYVHSIARSPVTIVMQANPFQTHLAAVPEADDIEQAVKLVYKEQVAFLS